MPELCGGGDPERRPGSGEAISATLERDVLPTPTVVNFKVTEQGITLTDVRGNKGLPLSWGCRAGQGRLEDLAEVAVEANE